MGTNEKIWVQAYSRITLVDHDAESEKFDVKGRNTIFDHTPKLVFATGKVQQLIREKKLMVVSGPAENTTKPTVSPERSVPEAQPLPRNFGQFRG